MCVLPGRADRVDLGMNLFTDAFLYLPMNLNHYLEQLLCVIIGGHILNGKTTKYFKKFLSKIILPTVTHKL